MKLPKQINKLINFKNKQLNKKPKFLRNLMIYKFKIMLFNKF